jgi:hypothetical protein
MILLESPNLTIEFKNVPCRHLVTTWRGLLLGSRYEEGITTILNCCHENDISKLLSDIRLLEPLTDSDQHYAQVALSQYTEVHGFLYQAIVMSSEVFSKFTSASFGYAENELHHIQHFFSNEGDAMLWLQQADL